MPPAGWHALAPAADVFHGPGRYPIVAYSEFMPPPRLGWKPYSPGSLDSLLFRAEDLHGWHVSEFEVCHEIRPGLAQAAEHLFHLLARLRRGEHPLPPHYLEDNPYCPRALVEAAGSLSHDRGVVLLPLALSRTQDDKGRVRWTLFGGSEQGPARAFWMGFFSGPDQEAPAEKSIEWLCKLLRSAFGEKAKDEASLRQAGFRILEQEADQTRGHWNEGSLPSCMGAFLLADGAPLRGVRYLLTFRPFERLPKNVRTAYLEGRLQLLPSPFSLLFWGVNRYLSLEQELPLASQAALLLTFPRHRAPGGLRVPQSGVFHESGPHGSKPPEHHVHARPMFKRTHRWDRILRDQDELALLDRESPILHALFSSTPDDVRLYDKPMARNAQVWVAGGKPLLDGPRATPEQIRAALEAVEAGGLFGYRFLFPAMRVGLHEVYWHLPLVAFPAENGDPVVLFDPEGPAGYLTAYRAEKPNLGKAVELWPRFLDRSPARPIVRLYEQGGAGAVATARNLRKLLDAWELTGQKPLPRSLARELIHCRHEETLEGWLRALPESASRVEVRSLVEESPRTLPRRKGAKVPDSLTYRKTARRQFEVSYWKTIASLSEGTFLNKNNADCVGDSTTQGQLTYHDRQLETLGDYLLAYHARRIASSGLAEAMTGSVPFAWQTDFDYSWMGGWLKNQDGPAERDILTVIPGRDRSRAVIMADHYDTAYMADRYEPGQGGHGARLAACGADDNHSATAALMLAAPIFLELSQAGKLGCDVWLVHLTGEEFPADCLGARALTQRLVEGTLQLHLPGGEVRDLSGTRVKGVYVLDMVAHNNDRERNVFQISPGTGADSLWLAWQAHLANEVWNLSVPIWNEGPQRKGRPRGRRSPHGAAVPQVAPHLGLRGEVRPVTDPRSTLYNTDGQIFSDAGVPVVLFMENYDINRVGYHDTHDTMANIDLDYGSALAALAIEAVARAASEPAGF